MPQSTWSQPQGGPKIILILGGGQIGIHTLMTYSAGDPNTKFVIKDISDAAIEACRAKIAKMAASHFKMKPDAIEKLIARVRFITTLADLGDDQPDIIVESVFEDPKVKADAYAEICEHVKNPAIVCIVSSHHPIELAEEHFTEAPHLVIIGTHPFSGPNSLVEVISSAETDKNALNFLSRYLSSTGRRPIHSESRWGFIGNPCLEIPSWVAMWLVQKGIATTSQVDAVARKVLGTTPFNLMNMIGGTPIVAYGMTGYGNVFGCEFPIPENMAAIAASRGRWEVASHKELDGVEVPDEVRDAIKEAIIGAFLAVAGNIVDNQLATEEDTANAIALLCHEAFRSKSPQDVIKEVGGAYALAAVRKFRDDHPGFQVPKWIEENCAEDDAPNIIVTRDTVVGTDEEGNVTILRLESQSLGEREIEDLLFQFEDLEGSGRGIVVVPRVPSGRGANVKEVLGNIKADRFDEIERMLSRGVELVLKIHAMQEHVAIPVIGMGLGGYLELCAAAGKRVAGDGSFAGLPEAKLGFPPGWGGLAWMLHLGIPPALAIKAVRLGMVAPVAMLKGSIFDKVVAPGMVVEECYTQLRGLLDGSKTARKATTEPLFTTDNMPAIEEISAKELAGLSRSGDEAIVELARYCLTHTLEEGVRESARVFMQRLRENTELVIEGITATVIEKRPVKFADAYPAEEPAAV